MNEPTKAVAVKEPAPVTVPETTTSDKTPAQSRTDAVSLMLAKSYESASNLHLTTEENEKLRAPFDDKQVRGGAKGKENLLYISHIHLSDRLNDVIGIGQWVMLRRSERIEGNKVYVDCVLLIRGTLVAEAIGSGDYRPNNAMQDFGDAIEIAMSDALQRLCKRLGIGSQVWDAAYCEGWISRNVKQRPSVTMPLPKPTDKKE